MKIQVFEPALCCNTGVCGPELDQNLVTFTADLAFLQAQSVDAQRHNLANDPTSFVEDPTVKAFMNIAGSAGLPLTIVDGVSVLTGRYPSRAELLTFAGLAIETDDACCSTDSTNGDACCSTDSTIQISASASASCC